MGHWGLRVRHACGGLRGGHQREKRFRQTNLAVRDQLKSSWSMHRLIPLTESDTHTHTHTPNYRCNAKPDYSLPGYPPCQRLITVNWSVSWFACIQCSTCTSCHMPPCHTNPILWTEADETDKNLVSRATSLEGSKN